MSMDECVAELNNLRSSCVAASDYIKDATTTIEIVSELLSENPKWTHKVYNCKRAKKLRLTDDNMVEINYTLNTFVDTDEFNIVYEQFHSRK